MSLEIIWESLWEWFCIKQNFTDFVKESHSDKAQKTGRIKHKKSRRNKTQRKQKKQNTKKAEETEETEETEENRGLQKIKTVSYTA